MLTGLPRCTRCYKIIDVQPFADVVMQDEGIRDGHYYAVYCRSFPQPRCAECRHRIRAMERLVNIWIHRGDDVRWL